MTISPLVTDPFIQGEAVQRPREKQESAHSAGMAAGHIRDLRVSKRN